MIYQHSMTPFPMICCYPMLPPRGGSIEINNTIREWLRTWSAEDPKTMTGHGIPQGPLASDFLAEAFFLPIDLSLQKERFRYLRYVDDIRIFGRTEGEVRNAALILEQKCRDRGLIPQTAKFEIRRVRSPSDAMGSLPSIPPTNNREPASHQCPRRRQIRLWRHQLAVGLKRSLTNLVLGT